MRLVSDEGAVSSGEGDSPCRTAGGFHPRRGNRPLILPQEPYPITKRERLEATFTGGTPDRTPVLGGWISCPEHICALTGLTLEEYWDDPEAASIRAYEILDTDGLISIAVPATHEDFRIVTRESYAHARLGASLEQAVAQVDAMASAEEVAAAWDPEAAWAEFRESLVSWQARCGEMLWMPAQWGGGAAISWYGTFGYENFFMLVAAYPDRARKLVEIGGATGRQRCLLVARAVREGLFPHAVLLGEDICTQRGPMISPRFMEEHYAPQLRRGLEPLLEVGCRPVWHCDGDVRPLLDMLIDCGVQGLQGFQPECGLNIDVVSQMRTREGEPLVIFGPLAVTTELPVLPAEEIKRRVRHAIEVCRGNARLALFTANTINPDVPLENVRAMYEAAHES